MITCERIQSLIEAHIPDSVARVENEYNDGEHFAAEVMSPAFEGARLVRQHQMVYRALGDLMSGPIHALALKTYTPDQWPY